MELLWSILLAVFLVLAAAGMMIGHLRTWRAALDQRMNDDEHDYRRRQVRRRMQTSGMLALISASLPIGVLVMSTWPKIGAFFWGGVLLLVGWVGLLALADMWATKYHYGRVRRDNTIEEAKLQAELNRLQSIRGNGKAHPPHPARRERRQD